MFDVAIIAFVIWQHFSAPADMDPGLRLPLFVAYVAAISLVVSVAVYFFTPRVHVRKSALVAYLSLLVLAATLIVASGGPSSRFTGAWVLVAFFAPLFGKFSAGTAGIFAVAYSLWAYSIGLTGQGGLIAMTIASISPIIAGALVFGHTTSRDETREDRTYNELASELSQVASKSEVVINVIGDGVLMLDGKGVIQLINPAAQQLLGWGKSDSLNLAYGSVFKMRDTKNQEVTSANDPIAQSLAENHQVKNDNFSLETRSGKTFLASISVSPIGQPGSGVIVVFRDITIERSDERQRAEFISTASHEMRTPVASIEGYLGLALNPATAQIDEKAREFITKAHESAEHLGRLFQDLLDVSKADDSRLKNTPKVVDVVPFVRDIIVGFLPKAKEKGLTVTYKPDPIETAVEEPVKRLNPIYYANVDNDHLREVTQNLIENAIKYTKEGSVTIDVTGDVDHIVISVTDSGIGIPREDQAHLFQKFYRVDNSDTREIGGTGLGLYLCRRLAEAMGGRIWVESEYKKGSTFFVEIPRIERGEAQRLIEQASVIAEEEQEHENAEALADAKERALTAAAAPSTPVTTVPPAPAAQPSPSVIAPSVSVPPVPTPLPQAAPAPVFQPPAAQPIQPQAPPATPTPDNTPLSSIEANPGAYLATRRTIPVNVPPRQE